MITELNLRNFKCFESVDIPLKQVNILTGINGMGKSTVIQSLLLLKQSCQDSDGFIGLKLNGNYTNLGNGQDVLYEKASKDEIEIGFHVNNISINFSFAYLPESDLLPLVTKSDIKNPIFNNNLFYLSAYRIEPQELYRVINEDRLESREFGNTGEFAIQYLKAFGASTVSNRNIILRDRKGNENDTLGEQVQLWLDMISPGVSPQINVDMKLRKTELKFEFIEGREKSNSYKSINVGFGITYVLPVIVALIAAREGDTILIENPEAHLHPAGQRKLGELLAAVSAGGIQLIVETHSDHILNGIRVAVKKSVIKASDANFLYFYKDSEDDFRHKIKNPILDEQGRIDEWPSGFFDEWDNALMELL